MRDPTRISPLLAKLNQAWSLSPDMRLGQLVECLRSRATALTPTFYLEDDLMEKALDRWIEENTK